MNLRRILETLSSMASRNGIPQGIIDEGRIFALGTFVNDNHRHDRVREVLNGLKDHVGQPFDIHPWAFTFDISTFEQDGNKSPFSVVGIVRPQADGSVSVDEFIATPRGFRPLQFLVFWHTATGTTVTIGAAREGAEEAAAGSIYPAAIAILNTGGCSIDLVRAPAIENERRKKRGKPVVPARYEIDAAEYFTALGASNLSEDRGGTHASPAPHLRRAHERTLQDGSRIWVRSALVNVRREGDIAFVERRKSYTTNAS